MWTRVQRIILWTHAWHKIFIIFLKYKPFWRAYYWRSILLPHKKIVLRSIVVYLHILQVLFYQLQFLVRLVIGYRNQNREKKRFGGLVLICATPTSEAWTVQYIIFPVSMLYMRLTKHTNRNFPHHILNTVQECNM